MHGRKHAFNQPGQSAVASGVTSRWMRPSRPQELARNRSSVTARQITPFEEQRKSMMFSIDDSARTPSGKTQWGRTPVPTGPCSPRAVSLPRKLPELHDWHLRPIMSRSHSSKRRLTSRFPAGRSTWRLWDFHIRSPGHGTLFQPLHLS